MGGGGRVDGSYRSSPATFETPVRHDRSPSGSTSTSITDSERQRQQSVLLQSLDEFLEKHTSEDNESFEEMMDEAKRKHRIKVRSQPPLQPKRNNHPNQPRNNLITI